MPNLTPTRVLRDRYATTTETESRIVRRLEAFLIKLREKAAETAGYDEDEDLLHLFTDPLPGITHSDKLRIRARAARFIAARDRLPAPPKHAGDGMAVQIGGLSRAAQVAVVTRDEADVIAAALHARAPWLNRASTVVMDEMRRRCASGFGVPVIEIDLGAVQSGAFSVAGLERGWGSAGVGRVVQAMLDHRIANPVVILDEIGQASMQMHTSGGKTLPGLIPALMAMIEPVTAQSWTCPYLQLPFDLSRLTWVMTTNSIATLPQPFLDRCRVIRCQRPELDQMRTALRRMSEGRLWEDDPDDSPWVLAIEEELPRLVARGLSLRQMARLIDRAATHKSRPMLM